MRKALGKGLEALFPGVPPGPPPGVVAGADRTAPAQVAVREIVANPEQPRRHFDEEALAALAASIARHGILQPIVVRPTAAGYELIAGERRLRAAQRAGLETVPAVIRETPPAERLELALIENLQRQDLSALEEAEAYRRLIDEHGLTQDEIARRVGKSRPAVTNALRLLSLPDAVKAQLESGELSAGHARAVLSVNGAEAQILFAREIVVGKLSKNEAEGRAAARRTRPARRTPAAADLHLRAVADELTRGLGTRVRIAQRARGGTIEIEFYSDAELDRLVGRLRSASAARL
jgi:ParB family chromosome partitioning protein